MKKVVAIAAVLMVFALGVAAIHAQQTDTKDHGMMPGTGCLMMAKAEGAKCALGSDGKCPMAAGKCPMPSHHSPVTSTTPGHAAP